MILPAVTALPSTRQGHLELLFAGGRSAERSGLTGRSGGWSGQELVPDREIRAVRHDGPDLLRYGPAARCKKISRIGGERSCIEGPSLPWWDGCGRPVENLHRQFCPHAR